MKVFHTASNPLDAIFVTSNLNGQLSIYDYAFNNISFRIQKCAFDCGFLDSDRYLISPERRPLGVKKLQFISPQTLLVFLVEDPQTEMQQQQQAESTSENSFHLALVNFTYKLNFKTLINEYLSISKYEEALNVLRIINWNCSSNEAYYCLNRIFQHLIKLPLNEMMETQIESTLGSFLIPMTPIDFKIFEQILPYIRYLAIRFFYHLLHNRSFEKAYKLAVELKSRRLFLLLHEITRRGGFQQISISSFQKAQELI